MIGYSVGSDLRRMVRGRLSALEECEGGTRVLLEGQEVIISSEPEMHQFWHKEKLVGHTVHLSRKVRNPTDWYLTAQDGPLAGTTYAYESGKWRIITRSQAGDPRRMNYKLP